LILLSDNSSMLGNDNGFVLSHIISFSPMIQRIFISLQFAVISALLGSLAMASSAWAYKVEKILRGPACHRQRTCAKKMQSCASSGGRSRRKR